MTTKAFFGGFGGGPKSGGKLMVCIDWGISTVRRFRPLPKDWERLLRLAEEPLQGVRGGQRVGQLAAQKKAIRAALAAEKKGGPSKRQLLKQKMMEEQAAMNKQKGGFFGR